MNPTNQSRGRQPKPLKVLFADDEAQLQDLIADELPRMGCVVTVCPDGATAVAAIEKNTYDCIIVDLDMPGLNGIQVIERAKQISPHTEAIVLTGKSSKDSAIAALRLGAFDYLQKPCTLIELQTRLQRVTEKRDMQQRLLALERRVQRAEGPRTMIGDHPLIEQVRNLIGKVAPTESTVLVTGETGTGKELVARAIHDQSLRADKPFLAINCGALPENLIESELFGHRKGAFTGADENRAGLFEVADGGTLFLDEIGELPLAVQSRLLRVLETGEVRRVGDNHPFKVDVRIVCATHRNLSQMVPRDKFREDLMYRINTFQIHLPPLRDRHTDIPLLAENLLARVRSRPLPDAQEKFTEAAINVLLDYPWPGNIRELANVIEHAAILCETLPIDFQHLPANVADPRGQPTSVTSSRPMTLREMENIAIWEALDRHNGNKAAAAEELGVSIKTLYNKINQESLRKAA
ncbi:MAG: sigma-54-dependent Fis family transcriptional regulator [Pirellulaceae bacterium]|nr:sigma-54-dependent Fis family transcriptional regulator [Pirellulaceae bacterium]